MQQHDASLVEQALAGDKAAFGPLVERHQPGALRLSQRLLGEPADAADVTQEAPETLYEVHEWHSLVPAAIATLPIAQQDAVRLYYLDGLSLRDLSVLASVPIGTVKARLHRARARLRQILTREDADGQLTVLDANEEERTGPAPG